MGLGSIKLRDMRTEREEPMEVAPMSGSEYPYGLRLHLDQDGLAKLGISLPDVGEQFVVVGIGVVTSVSEHKGDGQNSQHVEVQLEKLAFDSRDETINLDS